MNVLSLFEGMSCGRIALDRAGIKVATYFTSEVDKYAISVAKHNYPDIKHIGDVTQVKASDLPKIDLIIGGSPCQGFSFAGKQLNFDDPPICVISFKHKQFRADVSNLLLVCKKCHNWIHSKRNKSKEFIRTIPDK